MFSNEFHVKSRARKKNKRQNTIEKNLSDGRKIQWNFPTPALINFALYKWINFHNFPTFEFSESHFFFANQPTVLKTTM